MSLQQFAQILWARRSIVLAALLSCVVAAVITSYLLPERYTGRARVVLDIIKPDPVTGLTLATQFARTYTGTQIAMIKDYQVAEPTIDKLGWANNPQVAASFAGSGAANEDLRHALARELIRNTDAQLLNDSNVLEITYVAQDPDTARKVATAVRDTYLEQALQTKREGAGKTADWYQQQVQQQQALVEQAEGERARYAKEHNIVLDPNNTDVENARLAALSATSATAVGAAAPASVRAGPGAAQAQLIQLDQQIAQASTQLGPNHPTLQAMKRQRTAIAQLAAREAGAGAVGGGGPNVGAINAEFARQKAKVVARTPEVERLQSMTRDIEQKRAQLTKIADKSSDARLGANIGETGLVATGIATAPDKPDYPNRPLIWIAALAFGLFLGVVLALLVELLGRRVRTGDDLELVTGAPVLAIVKLSDEAARPRRQLLRRRARPALPAPALEAA